MKIIIHIPWYMYLILWTVKSDIEIKANNEGIYTTTFKIFNNTKYITDVEFQEYK